MPHPLPSKIVHCASSALGRSQVHSHRLATAWIRLPTAFSVACSRFIFGVDTPLSHSLL